jgi:hypothetical protein
LPVCYALIDQSEVKEVRYSPNQQYQYAVKRL